MFLLKEIVISGLLICVSVIQYVTTSHEWPIFTLIFQDTRCMIFANKFGINQASN